MGTYDDERNKNQTVLTELRGGSVGGWKRRVMRIAKHTRDSQVYPDAELSVQLETCDKRNDLGVYIEETFEMSNGQTRTKAISFTITAKNVIELRKILNEIDTDVVNP